MPDRPPINRKGRTAWKRPAGKPKKTTERGLGWDWQKVRDAYIEANPLCVDPFGMHVGRAVPAESVDHILSRAKGGDRLDWDNLQSLCNECHKRKTYVEQTCDRPVCTVVCGPPASGKTTYVETYRLPGDVVVDMGALCAAMTGSDDRSTNWPVMPLARAARDAIIKRLSQPGEVGRAWIVGVFADVGERNAIAAMTGADVVVMDASHAECIRRVNADPSRAPMRAKQIESINRWFASAIANNIS